MLLEQVRIQRYRSIMDLSFKLNQNKLDVICGSNNVGKTNILRALNLFFAMDINLFNPKEDIPFHIRYGSVGGRDYTKLTGLFYDEKNKDKYEISVSYRYKNKQKSCEISGKKNKHTMSENETKSFMKQFKFIFVESSNINIPILIKNIFKEKALTVLDTKRQKQKNALSLLKDFQAASNKAILSIEKDLTTCFKKFLKDNPLFEEQIKDWKLEIKFPACESLREAISDQIQFTLNDSNNNSIETKGSGIQKIILISLINYVSQTYNNCNVIWGIDEPEAFLQPLLQKNAYNEFKKLAQIYNIVVTTHSNFFIDISDLSSTIMVEADIVPRVYARRPGKTYLETSTKIIAETGYLKFQKIKEHLGIERNDSWEIYSNNIIVEGETDKKYLETLIKLYALNPVRIVSAGGADNMIPLLELWNDIAKEMPSKPKVLCLLDHDEKGKNIYKKINKSNNSYKKLSISTKYIARFDGDQTEKFEYTIEDLMPPNIIIEELDDWLNKEKRYKKVTLIKGKQRTKTVYNESSILKFYDEKSKDVNEDLLPLSIHENLGIKNQLCKNIIKKIKNNNDKYLGIFNQYSCIKSFLENLVEF